MFRAEGATGKTAGFTNGLYWRQAHPVAVTNGCYPVAEVLLNGPVAQLVEHRTFNAVVAGSSPARLTILPNLIVSAAR